jgi:hypothetical protein
MPAAEDPLGIQNTGIFLEIAHNLLQENSEQEWPTVLVFLKTEIFGLPKLICYFCSFTWELWYIVK